MVQIYQQIRHESGIPLGGIGTGTIEVRPDGLFHEWQILNAGQWSPQSPCCCGGKAPEPDDLLFAVRTKTSDGKVTVRYLALREQLHNLYSAAWLKCAEGIIFEGRFPVATLTYVDDELPVEVTAEMFSPFVPNDSRNSATPGFYVYFTVRNLTDAPVEVSILGSLANVVGFGQEERQPHNRLETDGPATTIVLGADGLKPEECSTGEMAFSATGGEISYITAAHRAVSFHRSWWSRYGYKAYGYYFTLRDEGKLPNLDAETYPALADDFSARDLSSEERTALLKELMRHSLVRQMFERVSKAAPDLAEDHEQLIEFLDDVTLHLNRFKNNWGEAALCSRMVLDPDARQSTLFTVSWYFPNHISPSGSRLGHMYENWFDGASAANRHLVENFPAFRPETLRLPDSIYGSSLDQATADAVSSQLSTLTKCTWWTKSGDFGVWEGLGCCGFHTTDITYQGSFPIIALFPDLQKKQMTHGAKFQREDGRVHHLFQPDFSTVDEGFDRVDMNPQFVMLAARDYLWTGDRQYLDELWPHIVRAMENSEELDRDGDGLPDYDTKRNTYDVWDFSGAPSYIASLWLGSLKAAILLARERGEDSRAEHWQELFDKGTASLESKLWNGKYYILWLDEETGRRDEACMSDQMSGDWYCRIMGWGPICKPDRVRKALASIMHYNYAPDQGLINASYPPGVPHRQATSGNMQAEATWTGIEYTVAALLIQNDMIGEGLDIVHDIHNRYLQAGRFWNHEECGGHYYRALSSWTVLMALSGFELNVPEGRLGFAPALNSDKCAYPFYAPGVAGTYVQSSGVEGTVATIEITSGEIEVRTLSLPALWGSGKVMLALNGTPVPHKTTKASGVLRLTLKAPQKLGAGDNFTIERAC